MTKLQLPNLQQTVVNTFLIINMRNINNPSLKIKFGPPHADFGSVWSHPKARKFRQNLNLIDVTLACEDDHWNLLRLLLLLMLMMRNVLTTVWCRFGSWSLVKLQLQNLAWTLKQEMESDNDHATMRKSFLLVSLVGKCGWEKLIYHKNWLICKWIVKTFLSFLPLTTLSLFIYLVQFGLVWGGIKTVLFLPYSQ